jgi:hypothetical protein
MAKYSSYTNEYKPSEIYEQHISQNVRKILREDYEVIDTAGENASGYYSSDKSGVTENYEDEITKAFDYLEDIFDYNYNTEYDNY